MQPTVDEVHTVALLREWRGDAWLRRRIEEGVLRAGAPFLSGPYAGIVFASSGGERGVSTLPPDAFERHATLGLTSEAVPPQQTAMLAMGVPDICPDPIKPPCNGIMRGIDEVASDGLSRSYVLFAVASLESGSRARFESLVRDSPSDDQSWRAVNFLYGMGCGKDVLIEVLADTLPAAHVRLESLIDHDFVKCVEVMTTIGSLTRGFGGAR